MIRYQITRSQLEAAITAVSPNWLVDAAVKTAKFKDAGRYNEKKGTWSPIKVAYLQLQHNKCAYCERRLAGPPYGLIEHDVEHYRPKSSVKAWPTAAIETARKIKYTFKTGDASALGYYLLAYEVFNYATACKTCNSSLKSNYFPVAGKRALKTNDWKKLKAEKPFLIYPLGDIDNDPATLITFCGIVPAPAKKSGHSSARAAVTIDFFELDSREELRRERAQLVESLWLALQLSEQAETDRDRTDAVDALARTQQPSSPHSSCARAFVTLFRTDRQAARELFDAARQYLNTES